MGVHDKLGTALTLFHLLIVVSAANADSSLPLRLEKGFSAIAGSSSGDFQPLLDDPTGVFSFGFFRVNSTQLELGVLHLPSSLQVWRAIPARPAAWSVTVSLSFNGSLVLSDSQTGLIWSTETGGADTVVLLNTSNLRIEEASQVVWQSFDFPADTLVQGQNFTDSSTPVTSADQRFSLRLGMSYLGLYMDFAGDPPVIYWKHGALEYMVGVGPPVYARVEPDGFLAMYQSEDNRVDVLSFNSFGKKIPGLRRLTLESDGDLRAYRWNGSVWVNEFTAITDNCGLPTVCGAYGLCNEDSSAQRCQCLDGSGATCPAATAGDLCGSDGDGYRVVSRIGVDLANKQFLSSEVVGSYDNCTATCASNCSCWGVIYSNSSGTGYCYQMDYPIQTLVEANESKLGYFKVRNGRRRHRRSRVKVALLVIGVMIAAGVLVFVAYKVRSWWRAKGGVGGPRGEGLSLGPYRDLKGWASSKSIELFNSFKK